MTHPSTTEPKPSGLLPPFKPHSIGWRLNTHPLLSLSRDPLVPLGRMDLLDHLESG